MRVSIPRENGVSEMIGALLLVAVISLAVSIAGVTILSSVNTSQVPAVTFSLANESKKCDHCPYRRRPPACRIIQDLR